MEAFGAAAVPDPLTTNGVARIRSTRCDLRQLPSQALFSHGSCRRPVGTISPKPSPSLHPTQEWEGLVTGIHDDGFEKSIDGTRRSVSRIVFLDPPRLTQRDIEKGREWAEWLLEEWGNE